MRFESPLVFGTLLRRYKRFLADVVLEDGATVTAVCPNTGSMRSCATPGWRVALSHSQVPTRKYALTWELVHNGESWIGINTGRTNGLVCEAVAQGRVPILAGYPVVRREQPYGLASRIDILLEDGPRRCYVEVKNVTLRTDDGAAAFPDAVTARGLKHLEELTRMVQAGHRAVMCYVIQRTDCARFRIAGEIDAAYAEGFVKARRAGVEAVAVVAEVGPEGIALAGEMAM